MNYRSWIYRLCFVLLCMIMASGSHAATRIMNLGSLEGTHAAAVCVNKRGQVTGYYMTNNGNILGFLWENDNMIDLGTLGGNYTMPYVINDFGQIVGTSENSEGVREAFIWHEGKMTGLGTFGGCPTEGQYINNKGQVVGVRVQLPDPDDPCRLNMGEKRTAFLWEKGEFTDIHVNGYCESWPSAINHHGQIVGFLSKTGALDYEACLWSKRRVMTLGLLPGGLLNVAVGINDSGQIVGFTMFGPEEGVRSFIWEKGKMTDLGTLGNVITVGMSINNRGQVVGWSWLESGGEHAFL